VSVLMRIARFWPERWLPMVCCLPGLGIAVLVGASLVLAAPILGLDAGTPAVTGLIAMGVACPLTKLIAVLVLRRQMACPLPAVRRAPDRAHALAALRADSNRMSEQLTELALDGHSELEITDPLQPGGAAHPHRAYESSQPAVEPV